MLGWQPLPTYAELIGYLVYLVPARALRALARAARGVRARAPMTSGTRAARAPARARRSAGCGGDARRPPPARATVELKLTDAGCSPATLKLDAGRTTFKVTNAGTGRVSELEVLKGARILGEKENLVAGLSGSFTLTLQPGEYTLSCPGGTTAATGVVTVGGRRVASRRPTRSCRPRSTGYQPLRPHAGAGARHARAAVRRRGQGGRRGRGQGAVRRRRACPTRRSSRSPRASAPSTPTSTRASTTSRRARSGRASTASSRRCGRSNSTKGMGPIADKLLADVQTLEAKTRTLAYQPDELANGANGLLDEVATLEDHRRGGPLLAHRPLATSWPTSPARRRRSACSRRR